MDRTIRAALLAAFIGFAVVGGTLLFLGVPTTGSLVAGLVAGALGGVLLWAAGRRADTFHTTDTVTPVQPGFPGPPDHEEDGTTDGADADADADADPDTDRDEA